MYNEWLFIDKSDLVPEAKTLFPGARFKGTMERLVDWDWIRFVSVCYTPVGKTILNRCPNLKWVMVRGTAYEKVDLLECRRRGIGVAEAIPTQENCATYLVNHLGQRPFLFYGYGHIGKLAMAKTGRTWPFVNRRTGSEQALGLVAEASSIALSVSYRKGTKQPPVFGRRFFSALSYGTTLVSVCRPALTDNAALLEACKAGRIRKAVIDTVGKDYHKELMATGRVFDTGHTAWLTGMDREQFLVALKSCADSLMAGKPKGIVMPYVAD